MQVIKAVRHSAASVAVGSANLLVDRGLFGLRPLRTHILICGFPRSGSTLLQMMLASALPRARSFPNEVPALVAARRRFRNSEVMVTKYPRDIDAVGAIRAYYGSREPEAFFLIMVRDPRDILTSIHDGRPDHYYVDIGRVSSTASTILTLMAEQTSDTLVVRYEDLVSDPRAVEARLTSVLPLENQLTEYLTKAPVLDASSKNAIGRVRPPETTRIGRWKAPEHEDRVREVMQSSSELPELIARLGY